MKTHIALMKKSWGLTDKIINGEKTVESRWFKNRCTPWGKIEAGDIIYFKDTGSFVRARAVIYKVLQFENLDERKRNEILEKYGKSDLGMDDKIPEEVMNYFKGKNYCILAFFNNVEKVEPFDIDKTGFGMQAAWLIVDDIEKIRKQ